MISTVTLTVSGAASIGAGGGGGATAPSSRYSLHGDTYLVSMTFTEIIGPSSTPSCVAMNLVFSVLL